MCVCACVPVFVMAREIGQTCVNLVPDRQIQVGSTRDARSLVLL